MKKLILILSLSFMLAGEMEVDGDLNVSGDIQSPTIAQLQEIIEQLQAQIEALQLQISSMQDADNKLETRMYSIVIDLTTGENIIPLNMEDITGEDLPFATFKVVGMEAYTFFDTVNLLYSCDNVIESSFFYFGGNGAGGEIEIQVPNLYLSNQNCKLRSTNTNNSFNRNLYLAITAQFPETRSQK